MISDPNKEEFRVHKETIEGQPIAVKSAGPGLIEYLKREADVINKKSGTITPIVN